MGIIGRSGTLGYEAAAQLKAHGIGVSTSVGIGGEIGGPQEAEAADYIRNNVTKPVVAYVAGLTAPKGRTMGHAGAIISAFGESASEKVEILSAAGVTVAPNPAVIGDTIAQVLKEAA